MERREGGPSQKKESTYNVAEADVRWMLGDISQEQWEDALDAFGDLREEIASMEWFSAGPNSVSAGKRMDQWHELVFAPRDSEHEEKIKDLLVKLKIIPWEEVMGNFKVLVVENKRDVALLRGGLIFDFLADAVRRNEREMLLDRDRIRYEEQMKKVYEYVHGKKKSADEIWERRIDIEREEFSKMREEEREARIAAILASVPHVPKEIFEKPARVPQDQFYRFGQPSISRKGGVRKGVSEEAGIIANEEEPIDVDVFIEQMDQDFAEGRLNEEALAAGLVKELLTESMSPNLTLFPKKYEWVVPQGQKGFLQERSSKKVITNDEIKDVVLFAQQVSPEQREIAIREIVLMHRALILYVIRRIQERNSSASPDDMFQQAVQGVAYAVEHYDARDDTPFRAYMVPCVEGYIRKVTSNAQFRTIRVPVNISADRKKVIMAEQSVQSASPDRKIDPERVAQALYQEDIIKDPSMIAYDRYVRKVLAAYSEVGIDALEGEDVGLHDVDMKGESLLASSEQETDLEYSELQEVMDKGLLSLTPREERLIRQYYELDKKPGQIASKVYEEASESLQQSIPGISAPEVRDRIRMLTKIGNLKDPEVLAEFSRRDREIAETYTRSLDAHSLDETLDSVSGDHGVTRERIRQIIAKGLRKLKHPARARYLRAAMD